MLDILNSYSTTIGPLFILFGLMIIGLVVWEAQRSEIIVAVWNFTKREEIADLHSKITSLFSLEEIKTICIYLGIDYDNLPGDTKNAKVRELILECIRRGRLNTLIDICKRMRPEAGFEYIEGFGSELSRSTASPLALIVFGLSGLMAIVMGVLMLFSPPSVTLLSVRYEVGNWDPRQIDLSAAATDGIPASANDALQFMDLEIGVSRDAPQFTVKANVYDGETLVGYSDPVPMLTGQKIERLYIVPAYQFGTLVDVWEVQPAWKTLTVALIVERNGRSLTTTETNVRLNPSGDAWFIEPPTANFTIITYSVNNGPPLVLDLRTLKDGDGINVSPGDTLTIHDAWYHAPERTQDSNTLEIEAHLNSGNYDPVTALFSTPVTLQQGVHSLLPTENLQWDVPDGRDQLTIWLVRNDATVLDRLNIPLASKATAGLIPIEEAKNIDGNLPAISLLSLSFELGNYNPRLLDLRTNPPTLPVRENSLLQIPEIWLQAEHADPDLGVWVEIYHDEALTQLVGITEAKNLTNERLLLTDVTVNAGADEDVSHNWRIPAQWTDFYIVIVGQHENREDTIIFDVERVHFDEESAAWLDNSPNIGIVAVAYSINDGSSQLLDLINIDSAGIVVQPGDTLIITGVWYHFTQTYEERAEVSMEVTLLDSNRDSLDQTKVTTDRETVREGVFPLTNIAELRWIVPEDTSQMDILLVDQHGAVVDKLEITVNTE